jgi:tripartite-type tricarboxylate transporter receptor subunit TctC
VLAAALRSTSVDACAEFGSRFGPFREGPLKPLAITSPKRSELMPAIPAIAESGSLSYQLMRRSRRQWPTVIK